MSVPGILTTVLFSFLLFLCIISLFPRIALGSCLPSGMVAPHLTACMRNDKMGEASVLQNQTTVCNCPSLSSGFFLSSSLSLSLSLSRSLSLSISFSVHPDVCGVASDHLCPCSTPCIQIHSPKMHCQCRRSRCDGFFMHSVCLRYLYLTSGQRVRR